MSLAQDFSVHFLNLLVAIPDFDYVRISVIVDVNVLVKEILFRLWALVLRLLDLENRRARLQNVQVATGGLKGLFYYLLHNSLKLNCKLRHRWAPVRLKRCVETQIKRFWCQI